MISLATTVLAVLTLLVLVAMLAVAVALTLREPSKRVDHEQPQAQPAPSSPPFAASPPPPVASAPDPMPGLAAQWQQEAKVRDDRHKAEIRAHVDRPVPPLTDEGRAALARGLGARLAIKHIFPPRLPQRSMSYLGGLPIVPDNFDWPTVHNRKGELERLNFVAQLDCADLPPGPGRELLPAKGYLYFFAPLSDTFGPDANGFVCRYLPGKATKKWTPLDMPFTSKLERSDFVEAAWRGTRTHFDRVEVDFGWLVEPDDAEVEARAAEGHPHEVAEILRNEREEAFFGPRPVDTPLLASRAPSGETWVPYPGFPVNWHSARILRRLFEGWARAESVDVAEKLKALGPVGEDHAEGQRLRALQNDLRGFTSKVSNAFFATINANHKDHDAPPDDVKQKILAFLEQVRVTPPTASRDHTYGHRTLPGVLPRWIASAAIHGAELGLAHPDGAALFGPEVVAALAGRHVARKHHLFGLGEVVQVEADERKDRYLLLLQLGPDPALDWTVGEAGPLQYWITPEDLSAKKFENTVLTVEAY